MHIWNGCFSKQRLIGGAGAHYLRAVAVATGLKEKKMPESKNEFRMALSGVIEARGREATRSVGRAREHLLLGSITKRPN